MVNRREFLSLSGTAAAAALLSESRIASAQAVDSMDLVNPQFREPLKGFLKAMAGFADIDDATLIKLSRQMDMAPREIAAEPIVTEHMIPGPPSAPQVKVFVAGDATGASKPAVLHIHGGGYFAGSAVTARGQLQTLARTHDCVAVTVEYRLAPETRFPGALDDAYAALRWMNANAKDLGIDVTRVAVKGESAGAGHAATLAIAVRDRKEFDLCLQVLLYPSLDDRTGTSRKVDPAFGRYVWSVKQNRLGWTSLLGVPAGSTKVPANSVPARVANLTGLPPAFIGVGGIDLYAPEDIAYATRLLQAGVPTELMVVPGGYHGFDLFAPTASLTRQFNGAWNDAIRRAFAKT
jgi:acetyl esterase/lipase